MVMDKNSVSPRVRARVGTLCGVLGIVLNLVLFGMKLAVSLLTGYVSVMADAVNNLTDSFSSIVSLISFRMSGKPADEDHPFGHERIEYVASMIVAFIILFLAWELAITSIGNVVKPPEVSRLSLVSGIVLGVSVLIKLVMFFVNRHFAKAIGSSLLRATALDCVSDAVATSAVIVCAVVSPLIGFNLDGYAGLVIALFIAKAGIGIIKECANSIIGVKPDATLSKGILEYTKSFDGVLDTHDMIIHQYGPNRAFLSLHVEVDGTKNVFNSHDMIDNIEIGIYENFGVVATIHMDPIYPEDEFVLSLKEYAVSAVTSLSDRLSIHDFRVVHGETHTNILFDITKPYDVKMSDNEIKQSVAAKFKELNKNYNVIAVIDREFT